MEADALVIRFDHVTTVADNAAATKLYRSLAGIGLDVAWPYAEYPAFATGGVRVGNLILEILGVDEHAVGDWPPRFVTFAPPGLEGLVEELDARSIAHGDPEPFASGEGQPVLYTTISLPELGGPEVYVQLSAYAEPPRSEGTPSSGTAGVVETERVTIGIEDDSALARWEALFGAAAGADRLWRLKGGPAVELDPGGGNPLELVFRVQSIPDAERAFRSGGIATTGDQVQIGNLTARLVAAPAADSPG